MEHSRRVLSDYFYGHYTTHPDALAVPVPLAAALPEIEEPLNFPEVAPDCSGASEALVPVEHRRIRVLAPYWHVGWENAIPGAFVRSGVAERLHHAADGLPDRFGLAVFDAWRPLQLQHEIYEAAYSDQSLPAGFVSVPSDDPATPPPHLTGGTIDLTLTFDGIPLELGTSFDDFTDDARTDSFEGTPGRVRGLRRLLYWTMRSQGFVVIDCEWWHFEYGTRRWSALLGQAPIYGAAHLYREATTTATAGGHDRS